MTTKSKSKNQKITPQSRRKAVLGDIGAAYLPAAGTRSMKVETPDSMAAETLIAQAELKQYLLANFGKQMSVEEYVRRKLAYPTLEILESFLFAEQIDGVALAIYNIEAKRQGIIIGDQTGIGKGRQAAALIRYAILRGKVPIFFTEKPNLFSDIYRDIIAIGSEDGSQIKKRRNQAAAKEWDELSEEEQEGYDNNPDAYADFLNQKAIKKVAIFSENKAYDLKKGTHVVPFIVNSRELKSSIKDADGNILYEAPDKAEQDALFEASDLPEKYNLIMLTYSQIASGNKVTFSKEGKQVSKGKKAQFVVNMAKNNIIILDEAHNASGGDSSTGIIAREILAASEGTVFLSGTFAKRPENMALYAQKTAIGDVNSTAEGLTEAIQLGGVAMQEWVSSILVQEGQMLRRERGLEATGATVNWITLDENAPLWNLPNLQAQHLKLVDTLTAVIRLIIAFQTAYVAVAVKELATDVKEEMGEASINSGVKGAGVDNVPYFSKVFNVINQLLFSTKAEAVALHAINRLEEGKKVVIAFSSTMGSFVEELSQSGMEDRDGGTRIKTDFALVLEKALNSVMKIQISSGWGKKTYRQLSVDEISFEGQQEYRRILGVIRQTTTDICVSPIDIIKYMIQQKGYSLAEVTGRGKEVRFDKPVSLGRMTSKTGVVFSRTKEDASAAFRRFQDNEIDVLLINQSGATGASAHAVPTAKVRANQVKQRVMIIAQPELDVNIEVQKWGRINRTGQILPPIYDYIVSAIPAEQRPVMMLQNKLRSLFANTTSSQKSSKDILQSGDFLNKIGDRVVREYIEVEREENGKESIYKLCDLGKWMKAEGEGDRVEDMAKKVAGRVAIIPTARQKLFYDEVTDAYKKDVERLINAGEYDLEVETLNLKARLIQQDLLVAGNSEKGSAFGESSLLGLYEINNLNKPYTVEKVEQLLAERIPQGMRGNLVAGQQSSEAAAFLKNRKEKALASITADYQSGLKELNAKMDKAKTPEAEEALKIRRDELSKEYEDELTMKTTKEDVLIAQVLSIFNYFYPGRKMVINTDESFTRLVCLGIKVNLKDTNPYSLGKLYVDMAVASSVRKISINLANKGYADLLDIKQNSIKNSFRATDSNLATFWNNGVQELASDRIRQYIITGNLLQGMAQDSFRNTRIIDFTMADGSSQKGLLVPYSVLEPPKSGSGNSISKPKRIVTFSRCVPIIRSLMAGNLLGDKKLMIAGETENGFKLFVAGSKAKGGDIFTSKEVLDLVKDKNFTKIGDKMVSYVSNADLPALCEVLSKQFGMSCEVTEAQAALLPQVKLSNIAQGPIMGYEPFPKISKQEAPDAKAKAKRLKLMEMEAEALELELELELELLKL